MNAQPQDDDILDDLHVGVSALRDVVRKQSVPLSREAAASLQRLETAVPGARERFRSWRQRWKGNAVRAAQQTNQAVHDHPWLFTVSALVLGVLAGLAVAGAAEDDLEA